MGHEYQFDVSLADGRAALARLITFFHGSTGATSKHNRQETKEWNRAGSAGGTFSSRSMSFLCGALCGLLGGTSTGSFPAALYEIVGPSALYKCMGR